MCTQAEKHLLLGEARKHCCLPGKHTLAKSSCHYAGSEPRRERRTERDFFNFLAVRGKADGSHLPKRHCRISENSDFLHSLTHRCFTCINFLTTLFPEHEKSSEKTVGARPFQHVLLKIFLLPKHPSLGSVTKKKVSII